METDLITQSLHPDSGVTPTTRRIAQFIHDNRALALASSAAELAEKLGISDATVIRSVQAMGFASLAKLRAALISGLTSTHTPAAALTRTIKDTGSDLSEAIGGILDTQIEMASTLKNQIIRQKIAQAIRALHPCTRVAVFGIGPSYSLADYICRVMKRHGRISFPIGSTGRLFADDLILLHPTDAIVVMVYGTLSREVAILCHEAQRQALPIVLITDGISARDVPPDTIIIPTIRGKKEHIVMHSTTVAILEAIAYGLSIASQDYTLQTLDRLNNFRNKISDE